MQKTSWLLMGAVLLFGACAHNQQARLKDHGDWADNSEWKADTDDSDSLGECGVRVHFKYDSSDIGDSDRPHLERAAKCLKNDGQLRVSIEGSADERGTEEYNLALGDKRAVSVAKYLSALGAKVEQLKTVSFGEENPVCKEHDESCWVKNRRAAVRPTALKTASKE